jgi:hypothetical protein
LLKVSTQQKQYSLSGDKKTINNWFIWTKFKKTPNIAIEFEEKSLTYQELNE